MAIRTALAPLLNLATLLSLGVGLGLSLLMPIAMRYWVRVMQVSPSGVLAAIGLAIGVVGAIGSMAWFLIEAVRQSKIRRLTPGLPPKPLCFWHFPVHVFSLYLIALPTAVCLVILSSESPTAQDWARNEDKFVEAAWSVVLNGHSR